MQINILEGRAGYVVLMDHVSVTISYSFRCLTKETEKYTAARSWNQLPEEIRCAKTLTTFKSRLKTSRLRRERRRHVG